MKTREGGPNTAENVERVVRICGRKGRILILMQDNPDPDALACAKALRKLVQVRTGKRAIIGYGGVCGRAENRAMMEVLRIDAHVVRPEELSRYRTICLVDTQPVSGNNILFASRIPEIVIDHHNLPKRKTWSAEFSDVRPEYGACSTILYEYLQAAGIKMNTNLSTALFYGIQSDTQDLGREVSPAGVRAYQQLFLVADKKKLAKIRRAPVPADYFHALEASLSNSVVAGKTVISFVPACHNPEILAEVAELLLRLEGIRSSVCYGLCGDTIHLSARAIDARGHVDVRLRRVVARLGSGGGHSAMAGGQVPVEGNPEKRLELVRSRLLATFGVDAEACPLVPPEEGPDPAGPVFASKKEKKPCGR